MNLGLKIIPFRLLQLFIGIVFFFFPTPDAVRSTVSWATGEPGEDAVLLAREVGPRPEGDQSQLTVRAVAMHAQVQPTANRAPVRVVLVIVCSPHGQLGPNVLPVSVPSLWLAVIDSHSGTPKFSGKTLLVGSIFAGKSEFPVHS